MIVETPEIEHPGTGQVEPNDAEENKGKKKIETKNKIGRGQYPEKGKEKVKIVVSCESRIPSVPNASESFVQCLIVLEEHD